MRQLRGAVAAVLLLAFAASAQYSVEADLNGVVGDLQPDYIVTTVGQEVPVDIWFFGPNCIIVFGAYLCNPELSLEYAATQFFSPGGGWYFPQVAPPDAAGCILMQGQDFSSVLMCFPYKVAKVTYLAATDQSIADLRLGEPSAVLTLSSFQTVYFANEGEILARIQIGDVTATEATSWGSVKALFR